MPIFLVLIFLIIQAALYYYARSVAQAVAEDASRAARAAPLTAPAVNNPASQPIPPVGQMQGQAQGAANQTIASLDPRHSFLRGPITVRVSVIDGYNQVLVTVEGTSVNLIPGLHMRVRAQSSGPIEVFRNPGVN